LFALSISGRQGACRDFGGEVFNSQTTVPALSLSIRGRADFFGEHSRAHPSAASSVAADMGRLVSYVRGLVLLDLGVFKSALTRLL